MRAFLLLMPVIHTTETQVGEGIAFSKQRWIELFSQRTADSFRPRLSNIATLLGEIEQFSSMAKELPAWIKHVEVLRAELGDSLHSRYCARLCTPFERHVIETIVKCDSCEKVHLLARSLSIRDFAKNLESRVLTAVHELPAILPQKKQDADGLLGELATVCIHKGLGAADFGHVSELAIDLKGYLNEITNVLNRPPKQFVATVEVIGEASNIVAITRKAGLSIVAPETLGESSQDSDGLPRSFVSKTVEADTAEQSLQILMRKLRTAFDLYTLYCNGEEVRLPIEGWAREEAESQNVRIKITSDRGNSLHPRRSARSFTLSSLEILNSGRMAPSILNALELHAQTFRTEDRRIRLLNTWSALECLASSPFDGSIIGKVVSLTTPIMTWRRIEKIVRYLAISTYLWRAEGHDEEVEGLPNATTKGVPVEDLLITLCQPPDTPRIQSLLAHVGDNPLLKYRIYRTWEILHSPKKLHAEMVAAESRVTWQLWRIYRARNLLVHSGIETPMLEYLTDNLHYYFSTVLSRLLHGLSSNLSWTIDDSTFHWTNAMSYVKHHLLNDSSVLTVSDFVPTPTREKNTKLWM